MTPDSPDPRAAPAQPDEAEALAAAIDDLGRAFDEVLDRIERIARTIEYGDALAVRRPADITRIDDTICGLVDELARIKVATDERIARLERRIGP